jgi:pectate lyase
MRIISQNKLHSIDFDRTHIWVQHNTIMASVQGDNILLGTYNTEDRAIEILEYMHERYSVAAGRNENTVYCMPL